MCAGVNLPPNIACENWKSMEVAVCAKCSIAAMVSNVRQIDDTFAARNEIVCGCGLLRQVEREPQSIDYDRHDCGQQR